MTLEESLVHALIEDLAAGKLVETTQFQLIDDQKNVKIPSYLVYLAGLVVKTTFSNHTAAGSHQLLNSLTPRDHQQFESLQTIFSKSKTVEMPIFRLSPRLCPTENQLNAIQADLERKRQELETIASQAAEDLLSSAGDERSTTGATKTKAKTKKKTSNNKSKSTKTANQQHQHKPTETLGETAETQVHHDENLPPPSSTLEQLLSQIQTETTSTISQHDDDSSGAWIPVSSKNNSNKDKKKQNTQSQQVRNEGTVQSAKALQSRSSPSSSANDSNALVGTSYADDKTINDPLSNENSHETSELQSQSFVSGAEPPVDETQATKETVEEIPKEAKEIVIETSEPDIQQKKTATHSSEVGALEERIRQLEQALEAKEQKLQQEKKTHAKKLSQKQQQFDDQVQALQLRLYISETRLKTFEEALEQHVQAVTNNVSTTTTSLVESSPRRKVLFVRDHHQASSTNEEPPSPLMSRVLGFQKKQKAGVPPTTSG